MGLEISPLINRWMVGFVDNKEPHDTRKFLLNHCPEVSNLPALSDITNETDLKLVIVANLFMLMNIKAMDNKSKSSPYEYVQSVLLQRRSHYIIRGVGITLSVFCDIVTNCNSYFLGEKKGTWKVCNYGESIPSNKQDLMEIFTRFRKYNRMIFKIRPQNVIEVEKRIADISNVSKMAMISKNCHVWYQHMNSVWSFIMVQLLGYGFLNPAYYMNPLVIRCMCYKMGTSVYSKENDYTSEYENILYAIYSLKKEMLPDQGRVTLRFLTKGETPIDRQRKLHYYSSGLVHHSCASASMHICTTDTANWCVHEDYASTYLDLCEDTSKTGNWKIFQKLEWAMGPDESKTRTMCCLVDRTMSTFANAWKISLDISPKIETLPRVITPTCCGVYLSAKVHGFITVVGFTGRTPLSYMAYLRDILNLDFLKSPGSQSWAAVNKSEALALYNHRGFPNIADLAERSMEDLTTLLHEGFCGMADLMDHISNQMDNGSYMQLSSGDELKTPLIDYAMSCCIYINDPLLALDLANLLNFLFPSGKDVNQSETTKMFHDLLISLNYVNNDIFKQGRQKVMNAVVDPNTRYVGLIQEIPFMSQSNLSLDLEVQLQFNKLYYKLGIDSDVCNLTIDHSLIDNLSEMEKKPDSMIYDGTFFDHLDDVIIGSNFNVFKGSRKLRIDTTDTQEAIGMVMRCCKNIGPILRLVMMSDCVVFNDTTALEFMNSMITYAESLFYPLWKNVTDDTARKNAMDALLGSLLETSKIYPMFLFPAIKSFVVNRKLRECYCSYYPNVPKHLLDFILRRYIIHKDVPPSRMHLLLFKRAGVVPTLFKKEKHVDIFDERMEAFQGSSNPSKKRKLQDEYSQGFEYSEPALILVEVDFLFRKNIRTTVNEIKETRQYTQPHLKVPLSNFKFNYAIPFGDDALAPSTNNVATNSCTPPIPLYPDLVRVTKIYDSRSKEPEKRVLMTNAELEMFFLVESQACVEFW